MSFGNYLAFSVALTRQRYVVMRKDLLSLGTRHRAACHDDCVQGLMKPILNNDDMHLSRNVLCRVEYTLNFLLIGYLIGSCPSLIGRNFAGSPVPSHNLNSCLYFLIGTFNRRNDLADNLFVVASLISFFYSRSMWAYGSSPKATLRASFWRPLSSSIPTLWNTDSAKRTAIFPDISFPFPSGRNHTMTLISPPYLCFAVINISLLAHPTDSDTHFPIFGIWTLSVDDFHKMC